jgi:hypothetical protein
MQMARGIACLLGLGLAGLILVLVQSADAQPAVEPDPQDVPIVLRQYDISDLVASIPQHYPIPAPKPVEESGGTLFCGGDDDGDAIFRADMVDEIILLITDHVRPDSWRENGGTTGTIQEVNSRLIVGTSEAIHEELSAFLGSLRRDWRPRVVVVQAYWLLMADPQLREIMKPVDGSVRPEVPDAVFDNAALYARGQTMGFNDQTLYIRSRYHQPEQTTLNGGVSLQIKSTLVGDEAAAIVDVRSTINELIPPPATQPAATQPVVRPRSDDTAVLSSGSIGQQFETTLRLPLGRRILVGGMTFDSGRQVYLVLQVDEVK